MKFYNTLTREREEFVPMEPGKVRMYACGPTVYNYFHVGNARCFVVFDMLRRYLEYRGYQVTFVQNFTDIDDKVIRRANEEGVTYAQLSQRYIDEYFKDAQGLGIRAADVHPRATENIDKILEIVSGLVASGHAYAVNGDVYFRTKSFPGYGKLSHMPIDDLESGARIDVSEQKEDPLDFALWKAAKPGEPSWDSPWGKGRPGWHIECSAMVCRYLGESIDIHCGGQDLTFPHHENEIAQSECFTGKPFARYWLHNGYINVDNRKMSKSLNNFFTVRDVAEKYSYAAVRYFILSSQYRSPINFSQEVMDQAAAALERIYNCADALAFALRDAGNQGDAVAADEAMVAGYEKCKADFIEAMDDDFNTGGGVGAIFELIRELNCDVNRVRTPAETAALQRGKEIFDELVNLMGFTRADKQDDGFAAEIEAAIAARADAKKNKNYAEADRIRKGLAARGVTLEDTPTGTKYKITK